MLFAEDIELFKTFITIPNIVIYLIVINLITFGMMYLDKRKAKRGKWRVKEGTLMLLVLLGGAIRRDSRNLYIQT